MNVSSNKTSAIIDLFRKELKEFYDMEEVDNFIFFAFEHILGFSRSDLLLKKEETMSESSLLKFFSVIRKLKENQPIQYILGETEFYGLKFNVNQYVLIPRQETEELVDMILKDYQQNPTKLRILDVGTGSGCIAISLKKNLPGAEVLAMDVSVEALEVAKANAIKNKIELHFISDDIFNHPDLGHFDIIVSNPPYVTKKEASVMHANVLRFEPHLALFVEDDNPLLFYKEIAFFAKKSLKTKGKLYFEINEKYGEETKGMLEEIGFKNILIKKDLSGKDRMIKCEYF